MKQIKAIIYISLLSLGIFSCQNQEWEFPNFDYTTAYFPYQYPVRTLVLGDYNFDNSGDNEGKFKIGATMGGVYKNEKDVVVDISVDETLTNNLFNNSDGSPVLPMPSDYYTLSSDQIIIKNGQTFGMVEVQLTDDFFADPLAIGENYVIPLKIVSASTDSVLLGKPTVENPDPRVSSHWELAPKNFTLFGVKYVNEYHGKYLYRGATEVKDASGTTIDQIQYSEKYVTDNPVVKINTASLTSVTFNNSIKLSSGSPGDFTMEIAFDENGDGTISNVEEDPAFPVTGTAKFVKKAEEWNNKERDVIYLDYEVTQDQNIHYVSDTLVFRDKAVAFDEFEPLVIE